MRIEITSDGIYGNAGKPVPIGTEMVVKEIPVGWKSRCRVISGGGKGKTAVTNPAKGALPGDETKTATEVLAMAGGNFMAFKSAAAKLLGDDTPSKKDDIVAALEDMATAPE